MATVPLELPALYGRQHDAITDPRRIVCIESTTKAGKTVGCIVWQIGQMMGAGEETEQ